MPTADSSESRHRKIAGIMARAFLNSFYLPLVLGLGSMPVETKFAVRCRVIFSGGGASGHIPGNGSQSIQELRLHPRFYKKQINMDLLRVLELPPEAIIHSFGNLFRSAHDSFDINFKATIQQLVNLPVVIVIVSYSKHAVDIVPDSPSQH